MEREGRWEQLRSPEAAFEIEPRLHRKLWNKNKLVSQLYGYASGSSHSNPINTIQTPADAMIAYLDLTDGHLPTATTPSQKPTPPFLPGVLSYDPYIDNPSRMSSEDRKTAADFFDLMRENATETREVVDIIDSNLTNFIADFTSLPKIPRIDKADVSNKLGRGYGLHNFRDSILQLIARYIVLAKKTGGVTSQGLQEVLRNGFYAYAKTYDSDIPYYNQTYKEFDNIREKEKAPQEVYLGRDGMYAYIGRKAMDVSKRRALSAKKRVAAERDGVKTDISPKYLVYPRFYRDQLATETKAAYLSSQGITPKSNPVFFDTGFRGTVPEQILSILGFKKKEADKRIKLLSAEIEARRIKGISETERENIVTKIEYNMKPEEPASGIMQTEGGRLVPVAKPTSPEEQFIFSMVRLALVRHYWLDARS